MIFIYITRVLGRGDVKLFIICTVTGAFLQVAARRFLKNHPEFLEDKPVTEKDCKQPKLPSPQGGALVKISGITIKVGVKVLLNIFAQKGLVGGAVVGAAAVAVSKIPATAVAKIIGDALPQNLAHLEAKNYILVSGEKIYLDQCDQSLGYLINILEDEKIPFDKKEELVRSILMKYLDLSTVEGRLRFLLCVVLILFMFSKTSPSSFFILMKNLIQAIKEGKISKAMGRYIVRKLQKKGVPVDPELLDLVDS